MQYFYLFNFFLVIRGCSVPLKCRLSVVNKLHQKSMPIMFKGEECHASKYVCVWYFELTNFKLTRFYRICTATYTTSSSALQQIL